MFRYIPARRGGTASTALKFRFFRVSCEEIFTTEAPRGEAATKNRNISRKVAKHVLSNVEGAAKKLNFRTWRSWRLGGSNSLFMHFSPCPQHLCGAISESCFTGMPEDPKL